MFAYEIFDVVLKHYRREEFEAHALKLKYVREWRERTLSIPKVELVEDAAPGYADEGATDAHGLSKKGATN